MPKQKKEEAPKEIPIELVNKAPQWSTTAEELYKIVEHKAPHVRQAVAHNRFAPVEILKELINDPDMSVRKAAIMNPQLPLEVQLGIALSGEERDKRLLVERVPVLNEVAEVFVAQGDSGVLYKLCEGARASVDVVLSIMRNCEGLDIRRRAFNEIVQRGGVRHVKGADVLPILEWEHLEFDDLDRIVRHAASQGWTEVLEELATHESESIAMVAVMSPYTPETAREEGAKRFAEIELGEDKQHHRFRTFTRSSWRTKEVPEDVSNIFSTAKLSGIRLLAAEGSNDVEVLHKLARDKDEPVALRAMQSLLKKNKLEVLKDPLVPLKRRADFAEALVFKSGNDTKKLEGLAKKLPEDVIEMLLKMKGMGSHPLNSFRKLFQSKENTEALTDEELLVKIRETKGTGRFVALGMLAERRGVNIEHEHEIAKLEAEARQYRPGTSHSALSGEAESAREPRKRTSRKGR